jgi:hypothetical protein
MTDATALRIWRIAVVQGENRLVGKEKSAILGGMAVLSQIGALSDWGFHSKSLAKKG